MTGRPDKQVDASAREARDPLEQIAESYLERFRRGERPTVKEYEEKHPELADGIRALLPTLGVMEEFGPERSPPSFSETLPVFRQLGDYRVVREIARGGMGVVYEAEQESLGRHVALKVLPASSLEDDVQIERFRQEARAAARLHHTNIVPVFGVGEHEGVHYYAMQFIRGQSLAEVFKEIRRIRFQEDGAEVDRAEKHGNQAAHTVARHIIAGHYALQSTATYAASSAEGVNPESQGADLARSTTPLAVPNAAAERSGDKRPALPSEHTGLHAAVSAGGYHRSVARVGLQVADALAYAHGEGILHRDIKPSNLLLDTHGVVWVTDFGLAKLDDSTNLTQVGNVVGTLRYMAPERFQGHSTARSDVYSLGVTLYEILTLRPLFDDQNRASLVRKIAMADPVGPRRVDPAIPRDLETIVLKAIAKEPHARYASAQDLADDLRRFLDHEPITARRSSVPERLLRWCRRNPAVAGLSSATVGLLAIVAISSVFFAVNLAGEKNTAVENLERAVAAEREVKERLALARVEEGRAWKNSERPGGRKRGLAALGEAVLLGAGEEIRSDVIGLLSQMDLETTAEVETRGGWLLEGPAQEVVGIVQPHGAVSVCDGDNLDDPLLVVAANGSTVEGGCVSPGGRYIAIKYHRSKAPVDVWDLFRGELVLHLPNPHGILSLAFHPAEDRVAVGCEDGSIIEVGLPGGEELTRFSAGPGATRLAYSPSGAWLAVVGPGNRTRTVWLLDASTGDIVSRLVHPDMVVRVAWHPREPVLATACFDYKAHLWNVSTGTHLRELEGHTAQVVKVAFSPDGQLLASTSWDGRTILWNHESGHRILAADGEFTSFRRRDGALGFRVGDYRAGLWKILGGEEYRLLAAPVLHDKGPLQIAMSPDERWLAAACGVNGVLLWSLSTPREYRRIEAGIVHEVAFRADGSELLTLGQAGLLRWPIRQPPSTTTAMFGPPEPLGIRGSRLSLAATDRAVAVVQGWDAVVYELESPRRELGRFRHGNLNFIDLSASARWLVTGSWQGRDVLVWDIQSGKPVHRVESGTARVRFSPDERWLVVGTGAYYRVYDTSTWSLREEISREDAGELPGPIGFGGSPGVVVTAPARTCVALYSIERSEEIARFEPPYFKADVASLDLSARGAFLAASVTTEAVHLWNVRSVRGQLAEMGLDWEPALSAPLPTAEANAPTGLTIHYGPEDRWRRPANGPLERQFRDRLELTTRLLELDASAERYTERAEILERRGYDHDALADLDEAVQRLPEDPELRLARARILLRLERKGAAVEDLDEAVRFAIALEGEGQASGIPEVLVEALRERAALRIVEGRYHEARNDYATLLDLLPSDAAASESLAWAWVLDSRTPLPTAEVLPLAERAARARPKDYRSQRTYGAVLYHTGKLDDAESYLERAITLNGREPTATVLLYLAMVRHDQGRDEEALTCYRQALERLRSATGLSEQARQEIDTIRRRAEETLLLEAR